MSNWFSNFIPYEIPLVFEGISYSTPEHFFQAMKTEDPLIRQKIAKRATARDAKRIGRSIELCPYWEEMKDDIMRQAQIHRYRIGSKMLDRLLGTRGEIVEWNTWHDTYWGKCLCSKCQGHGLNKLGIILMEIRERHWNKL